MTAPLSRDELKLNDQATFWLDSWVSRKTNANEIARANARSIGVHIAALHNRIAELEARCKRLETALNNFGDHRSNCIHWKPWVVYGPACDCGYSAALAAPLPEVKS